MDDPAHDHSADGPDGADAIPSPASSSRKPSAIGFRRTFDWFFRDRDTGEMTIVQVPNLPLWAFLASVAARQVVPTGSSAHTIVAWLGVASLGWWSADELVRGVNPWRRLLGVGGAAFTLASAARLAR